MFSQAMAHVVPKVRLVKSSPLVLFQFNIMYKIHFVYC